MSINVIGLLNIAIEDDEFIINDNLKLVSRDYFEKNSIVMPKEIRFYKTFIVSEHVFQSDFSFNQLDLDSQKAMPLYFLLALRLFITEHDIISSEWFVGDNYENLKEFIKINEETLIDPFNSNSKNWIESFIINKIANLVNNDSLADISKVYSRILDTYIKQSQGKETTNIHWLIAFTRFQEYYFKVNFAPFIRYIQSSLETLLVNTEDESPFRARYYATLIAYDDYDSRIATFKLLSWIYNITDFELEVKILSANQLEQKVKLLKEIMAKILIRTSGLNTKEIKQLLQHVMFGGPSFLE